MYLHDQLVHKTIIEGCTGSRNHCTGFPDAPHRNLEKTALSEWNIHMLLQNLICSKNKLGKQEYAVSFCEVQIIRIFVLLDILFNPI